MQDTPTPPYPKRRGRTPKRTFHPLGRIIRERRMAKGLSLAQLADAVGIRPTSVSLVAAMEHGTIPPRRDVAERLAAVLDLDLEPLLMWADTRMTPRRSADVLRERELLETQFTRREMQQVIPRRPANPTPDTDELSAGRPTLTAGESSDIPIFPAGTDPDALRRKPLGYLDRSAMERLIAGRAALIDPLAYRLSDDDFERLRRVVSPLGRPLHALVSRPQTIDEIDPREPYAIRFNGRVILAYCAWDGRDLVVLQPPGHAGFARLRVKDQSDLRRYVVGQVVALNWWDGGRFLGMTE